MEQSEAVEKLNKYFEECSKLVEDLGKLSESIIESQLNITKELLKCLIGALILCILTAFLLIYFTDKALSYESEPWTNTQKVEPLGNSDELPVFTPPKNRLTIDELYFITGKGKTFRRFQLMTENFGLRQKTGQVDFGMKLSEHITQSFDLYQRVNTQTWFTTNQVGYVSANLEVGVRKKLSEHLFIEIGWEHFSGHILESATTLEHIRNRGHENEDRLEIGFVFKDMKVL